MSKPIIEVNGFSYKYPRTEAYVLRNLNLKIYEGEFVGIVGPTGGGKTTLCMALCGLIPQILGGTIEGEILINGKNTNNTPIDQMIYSSAEQTAFVGITFQDPEAQIVGMTVEEDLAFGPENLGLPAEEIEQRITETLKLIRMEGFRNSFPYLLSGGEKQRIGIGATLALRPKVVILDEPTSELDPVGRTEVLSVIRSLKESSISVVIVEHNTEELIGFADRVIVLHEGQIVLNDTTEKVLFQVDELRSTGVRPPEGIEFLEKLVKAGVIPAMDSSFSEENIVQYLSKFLH